MTQSNHRLPRGLSTILNQLFALKGYGRVHTDQKLDAVWRQTVGDSYYNQTRIRDVRHGVLTIIVAHPTLLEELNAFYKPQLLSALRNSNLAVSIYDIRFRIGIVNHNCDAIS